MDSLVNWICKAPGLNEVTYVSLPQHISESLQ